AETQTRLDHIKKGLDATVRADVELTARARDIERRLKDLQISLSGDPTLAKRNEPTPPSITDRVARIVAGQWTSTSPPTRTNQDAYRHAAEAFAPLLGRLTALIESDLAE